MSDAIDRRAILSRRAAFVAGALAGLGSGAARADEPPAGPAGEGCRVEPTPAQKMAAEAMFDEAHRELEAGRRASAAQLAMQAHTLMKRPKTALLAARLLHEGGDFLAALVIEDQLACTGPDPELSELLARVETEHGAVLIEVKGTLDWSLEIDQRPVAAQHRSRKLRLPPGKHRIVVNSQSSSPHQQDVEVLAGTDTAITISLLPPLPCLSPCLSPPPRRPSSALIELGSGLIAPALLVSADQSPRVGAGGGTRLWIAAQMVPYLWFTGDMSTVFTGGDVRRAQVSTFADLRYQVLPWYALGLGFSAGAEGEIATEREVDATPVWGPYAIPAAFAYEWFRLEVRVPCLLDATPDRGPVVLAPQVVVGLAFEVARRRFE